MLNKFSFVKLASLLLLASALLTASAAPAVADEAAAPTDVKWSDVVGYKKGFYIQTPDENYKLTITGYAQGLAFLQFVEGAANTDTFRVRRARLKFAGNVYNKNIGYEMEYEFARSEMLSAFLQYSCDKTGMWARIGQTHVPFDFEALTSTSSLQFVDRSLAYAFFGIPDQREPGLNLGGALMDKMIEFNLGVFNGEGINAVNANNEFRYAGRLVVNAMGHHGYDYSDVKDSEEPAVALGFGAMYNDTPGIAAAAGTADKQVTSFSGDLGAKYRGMSAHGSIYFQSSDLPTGASTDDTGWMAQVGYFLMPKEFEVAARVAQVMPDAGGDQAEYTGGLNYFLDGHNVKVQADYSMLTVDDGVAVGNDRLDHRIRLQFQIKI